ncbi:MAG: hypothetical protein FWH27_18895 [Planctomycetaceae bacterium]|nr:hypothetical protein [Planctomycetaceae bacterium]
MAGFFLKQETSCISARRRNILFFVSAHNKVKLQRMQQNAKIRLVVTFKKIVHINSFSPRKNRVHGQTQKFQVFTKWCEKFSLFRRFFCHFWRQAFARKSLDGIDRIFGMEGKQAKGVSHYPENLVNPVLNNLLAKAISKTIFYSIWLQFLIKNQGIDFHFKLI